MPLQDIGAIYTPSIFGRTSFPLKHKGDPIFYKIFDAANSSIVNLTQDSIYIQNHFFKTGEPLKYTYQTGSPIGISSSSIGAGGTITSFPETVYPIVLDKDRIRVALASSLALSNQYVNITSLGIGTQHSFEAFKQNSKCLISVDNIIQSPVSVAATVGIVTYSNINIIVDKIKNIKIGTNIKIGAEIVRVSAINYDTKQISISRGENLLGTPQINFNDNITASYAEILSGTYNIVKDKIYFTDAPLEGKSTNVFIPLTDIDFATFSFSFLTNDIITGDEVYFFSNNPPQELVNGQKYYIIKNAINNFSLASNFINSLNNVKIEFTNISGNEFAVEGFQLFAVSAVDNSSFQGRVFLKSNYDGNYVFDDISEQFTGITSSFGLTVSGINTVGIKSDNGIVLINNVFQYPEFEESFKYEEVGGTQTNLVFNGSVVSGISSVKDYDVNVRGLPRGGIIISYESTGGHNYQPLVQAEGTAQVSAGGTISDVFLIIPGSGYRSGLGTYYVTFDDGEGNGSGALAIAEVADGKVVSVGIITGGSGYQVGSGTYFARFDPPLPYENVPVTGSSGGIGALVSFDVNPDGKIEKLVFSNRGYNYKTEEILTPVGILTGPNYINSNALKIKIQEVAKDDFSAWNIGILQKFDDLTSKVNGRRKVFTLTETFDNISKRVSLESEVGSEVELSYNLLVFINDVLQQPGKSYSFTGGSQITFLESVPFGSTLKVYFYKGAATDSQFFTSKIQVKEGDKLQIPQHIYGPPPVSQNSRTVVKIVSSDTLRTEVYDYVGISDASDQLRSISWTPQSKDLIINGEYVSKSRNEQNSKLIVFTQLSSNGISTISGTFSGFCTSIIGINTSVGIGSLIQVGDYVEGSYVAIGVSIVSIGSSNINIGSGTSIGISTQSGNLFLGITSYSSSPSGINTIPISFYRIT